MLTKIEEFKTQLGLANVCVHYGQEDGLDQAVPAPLRALKLTGSPVEFFGKVKLLWAGSVQALSQMDFTRMPDVLEYPVSLETIAQAEQSGGWFVFGEQPHLRQFLSRYKEKKT